MLSSNNTISIIVIAGIIFVMIYFLTIYKKTEKLESVRNINEETNPNEYVKLPTSHNSFGNDSFNCKLNELDDEVNSYVSSNLLNKACSAQDMKEANEIKNFHKDFFDFRDKTNLNSSNEITANDKILNLYLNGELGQNSSGMKIKDIYDNATCGPAFYNRYCVRLPDNTSF